jgi:hypothetical protein
MTTSLLLRATVACLAILALAAPGIADEKQKPASALPGVEKTYSIVTPEPDEPADKNNGPLKVGKWELTVSGYVWVQVGNGSHGDGR